MSKRHHFQTITRLDILEIKDVIRHGDGLKRNTMIDDEVPTGELDTLPLETKECAIVRAALKIRSCADGFVHYAVIIA